MNQMRYEEADDIAVMDPPCIPKQGKTVYINDILSAAVVKKSPALSALRGSELLESVLSQPKNGKGIPGSSPCDRYVNMSSLVAELRASEGLGIFDVAERVNGWIVESLRANRKITVSFREAEASETVLGEVIGDIYLKFPEELISSNLRIVDIESMWAGNLEIIVRQERLRRDDPVSFARLMSDLYKIAMGDY